MNVLRTSLLIVSASALAGVYYGAPKFNQDLSPEPAPLTVVPATVAAGAARAVVVEATPQAAMGMASLDMYGPEVNLTEEETQAMVARWRQLQMGTLVDPVLPKPAPNIKKSDLYRSYARPQQKVTKLDDRYRERGFYAQSRWGQRGATATNNTPTGRRSIFDSSRWAKENPDNYRRVGNRLIRRTNKHTRIR